MNSLREALVIVLIAAGPACLAVVFHPQLSNRARAGLEPYAVTLAEVRDWHTDVMWIDARSPAEFAQDHIPDAIPFDEGRFEEQLGTVLAAWHPGLRVVVYCSSVSCGTSRDVAARLRDSGLGDVSYLHGGWEAWMAALRARR